MWDFPLIFHYLIIGTCLQITWTFLWPNPFIVLSIWICCALITWMFSPSAKCIFAIFIVINLVVLETSVILIFANRSSLHGSIKSMLWCSLSGDSSSRGLPLSISRLKLLLLITAEMKHAGNTSHSKVKIDEFNTTWSPKILKFSRAVEHSVYEVRQLWAYTLCWDI